MSNTKLLYDILDVHKELSELELFKSFIEIYPDHTKEQLLEENAKLHLMDFTKLIEKYYN